MEANTVELCTENQTESAAEENRTEMEVKEEVQVEPQANEDQTKLAEQEDPFAYLDRNDFTSEKYKIEVRNLPKHYGIAVSKLYIFDTVYIKSKYFVNKIC